MDALPAIGSGSFPPLGGPSGGLPGLGSMNRPQVQPIMELDDPALMGEYGGEIDISGSASGLSDY